MGPHYLGVFSLTASLGITEGKTMADELDFNLTRRERQVMDIIYARGEAAVVEVLESLPDPPSYSSIRTVMRILEEKGHLTHRKFSSRYIYMPTRSRREAGRSAVRRLLRTFFDGSAGQAVAALLEESDSGLDATERDRLTKLIKNAREEGH